MYSAFSIEKLKGDELPVSAFNPAGFVPSGTAAFEKRTVAFEIPQWDDKKCVQCGECSFVCPHAAIRPYIAEPQELEGAPDAFVTIPAHAKELKGLQWRIQVYPQDCVGCGSCSNNCPAGALPMQPLQTQLETQKVNLAFAQQNISIKDNLMKPDNVVGTQLQQPLLEFSGACAGCGETPYVKLLTQLFGPRMIIANATGCSSIWGGYMPSIPYTTNKAGRGPAWGNSLFEDNGEYGYGIAKGVRIRRAQLESKVMAMTADKNTDEKLQQLLNKWLTMKTDGEASFDAGKAIVDRLQSLPSDENTEFLKKNSTMYGKKSVWAVGGDGWAYDIGFGGLDEVLASGENINVLVLDTEGYSNTGGEMSKATQLGSVSGFSADGKKTPKKNLGRMFMQYGYVYVASVCLGADMQQCITAMREAEAYDGPSIVIALCPCISWGIKSGMSTVIKESRKAVEAGYWPLYRFNPQLLKAGQEPLIIDYKAPDGTMSSFLNNQNRFASLAARKPELSARLQSELAKEAERFFSELEKTTDVYKTN